MLVDPLLQEFLLELSDFFQLAIDVIDVVFMRGYVDVLYGGVFLLLFLSGEFD